MRPPNALATLLTLAAAGCNLDTSRDPLAPAAPTRALGTRSAAAVRTESIRGTLEAFETDTYEPATNTLVVHMEGTGNASHLGRFTMVDDGIGFLSTGVGIGRITYTAANGDMFTGTASGHAVIAGGVAVITDTTTITGGTGRFAGATGTLAAVRRLDIATGFSSGSIEGTIIIDK